MTKVEAIAVCWGRPIDCMQCLVQCPVLNLLEIYILLETLTSHEKMVCTDCLRSETGKEAEQV